MPNGNSGHNVFPSVSSKEAETLVVQCSDLTLVLSPEMTIEEIFCAPSLDAVRFDPWIDRDLRSIVSPDSWIKIDGLIGDNSASPGSEGAWRHLNFEMEPNVSIPLLAKYFAFEEGDRLVQLICARDLSPVLEMQQRLQKELTQLAKMRAAYEATSADRGRS